MSSAAKTIVGLSALSLVFGARWTVIAQDKPLCAPGMVFIQLKEERTFLRKSDGSMYFGSSEVDAVIERNGVLDARLLFPPCNANQELRISLGMDRVYMLRFPPTANTEAIVAELSGIQSVEYAEPDYVGYATGVAHIDSLIPNDPYFWQQWAFRNSGTNTPLGQGKAGADIKATYAWPICRGDTNITVAVLDTGLKWDHPDIADRVWTNKNEIPGNGIDDDQNGYVDDIRGWNFAYDNNNVSDDYGHGTNVASIIGEKSNNGLGYAGLDWACKIMPLKIYDSSQIGYYSWWAAALYYAANNGASVVNMSAGGKSDSKILVMAIRYAFDRGCFIAAAMMNTNDSTREYPAAYHDYVVAVGATDSYDRRCNPFSWGGGSNFGSWIDVVAPGNLICGLYYKSDSDYRWSWSGTSQATPMVSGLASLLLAQDRTRSPSTLREIIRATADDTVGLPSEDTPGYDIYYGYGRINCYRALTYTPTGVITQKQTTPTSFALEQNFPNPFNPTTTVRYELPKASHVSLKVFNVMGQEISTLFEGMEQPGVKSTQFNGSSLASGIYFCRLEAENFVSVKKMLLVK